MGLSTPPPYLTDSADHSPAAFSRDARTDERVAVRNSSRPIELFVLASGGALQISSALEIALATASQDVTRTLALGPKFAPAAQLLRPHWDETHVVNEAATASSRRRRHARFAAAVADRIAGRQVSAIYGCDVPSTRILATRFPAARVTLFDEGSSTIPLSRQRVVRLASRTLVTQVRDQVKLALGIDGPPIPVAHYISAFEPQLTGVDSLEPLTFDALRRKLSGVAKPDLGWIVGSRSREREQLGEDVYLQLLHRACDHLRANGCRSITYFAYPDEPTSSLETSDALGLDAFVAGDLHQPVELLLLNQPSLPGSGLLAMPRTSASVSLALLLRGTGVPIWIVRTAQPNANGRNSDLDERLGALAHRANPNVRALFVNFPNAEPF
jgi:hypothetical protein